MNRFHAKCSLVALLCLFLIGTWGCQGPGWFGEKKKVPPPGVVPPPEQIAELRELAKKAATSTPDEQLQISDRLAAMLHREGDAIIRIEAVRALEKYPTEAARFGLRSALKDSDADVRVAVCEALGRRGGTEAAQALAEALHGDVDPDVRLAAARALGKCQDPAALAALGTALDDDDPAMQYRAVQSLRQVAPVDLGDDVKQWRQYVKGEMPSNPPVSFAERFRRLF